MVQRQRFKKFATVTGTFAFALLIGYVMQYGDADASRFSDLDAVAPQSSVQASIDTSPLQPAGAMQPKTPAPIQLSTNLSEMVRFDAGSVKLTALVRNGNEAILPERSAYAATTRHDDTPTCPVNLDPTFQADALVALTITSTCRANMPFELRHDDLVISGLTNENGAASMVMPAFSTSSTYRVTFADGMLASANVDVPEADHFSHVVVQWADGPDVTMSHREDVSAPLGTIMRLGQKTGASDRFAKIYTIAKTQRLENGLQDLMLRADITPASCSRSFLAERFYVGVGVEPERKDIRITLPSCDYAGTHLELKKVLGGQTLLP